MTITSTFVPPLIFLKSGFFGFDLSNDSKLGGGGGCLGVPYIPQRALGPKPLKGALLRTIFQKKSTKGHDCYLGPVKSDLDSD
jgi:hypothetical protein